MLSQPGASSNRGIVEEMERFGSESGSGQLQNSVERSAILGMLRWWNNRSKDVSYYVGRALAACDPCLNGNR